MTRTKQERSKTTAENGRIEERREVGGADNLNYSAESNNTRTWPSQLSGNGGGEISFFLLSLWATFTALMKNSADSKILAIKLSSDCLHIFELFHPSAL